MTQSTTAPPQPANSLDLIFDLVMDRVDEQKARIGNLDSKSGFTLGAASILTGGVGILADGLAGYFGDEAKPMKFLRIGPLDLSAAQVTAIVSALILASFVVVVFATYQAFRLRPLLVAPDPKALADGFIDRAEVETKEQVLSNLVDAFERNKPLLEHKATWTSRSIAAIGLEAVLVVIVGIIQIWMV